MHDLIRAATGSLLLGNDHKLAFDEDFWLSDSAGFWKLENRQDFIEPDSDSWLAYARGDEAAATRHTAARQPELADYYRRIDEAGFRTHRVRVVDLPMSPYLRWEMELLSLRNKSGASIRVVHRAAVEEHETTAPLPEIAICGHRAAYILLYSSEGLLLGSTRYTEETLIRELRDYIADLHFAGTDLTDFWEDHRPATTT